MSDDDHENEKSSNAAREADAALTWNWCPTCKQHIDIDDDTHEGSRVRCLGCRAWYVVCCDGDGAWSLESEAEHDADAADAARGTAKDAAPLTHALDAEGNALCPYDPERLGYVSQRPERVTCPACMEAAAEPAPREPSAHDELARLLPKLPLQIRFVLHGYATECEIADTAEKDLARACSLLLDERERMTAAFANLSDDRIALHAGNEAQRDISATQERAIDALRARVAELEAVLNPKAADADLVKADRDAIGRLLVIATMGGSVESAYLREVRRAREHAAKRAEGADRRVAELEAHEPAGHRVAALLRAVEEATKDAVEETDDRPDHVRTGRPFAYVEGLREAARLVREHLGAPSPEDFVKLPRLSDAEIQAALDKGRAEAFPDYHPLASATLAAPSPLDLAVAEVCAVPPVKINDGPFGIEIDALNTITDLAMKSGHGEPREWLLKIAHVALRALTCDAPASCDYCRARDKGHATFARGCTCDAAKGGSK